MAADDETCHGNANFAIICSFISKFGEEFGLPSSIPALQRMLEDTENVDDELKEIHIKLLRKARKWFNKEKWERALVKFCHEYSSVDAWEIERFGYKKAKLSVKLELLKRLLELQFDCNAKFKGEVNKLDAVSLRVLPIGRDLNGHMYWYQLDKECNLRLYMQEVEEEGSWKLLCSTKRDLETLLENLGSKIDSEELKQAIEDQVKANLKAEEELKSEAVEEKNEECKVLESNSIETVLIKQEVDEKPSTCHSSDKDCSVEKHDDAEHQKVNSTSSPPIVASDISGNKIPLKDCIVNLQCDNINLRDADNENCVIKAAASDTNESKTNSSSVIKQENVVNEPPDQVHSIASKVNLDKSEEEVNLNKSEKPVNLDKSEKEVNLDKSKKEVNLDKSKKEVNLDKSEKDTFRSVDPSNRKSQENASSSLAKQSETLNRPRGNEKGDSTVLNKCANAKNSDNKPKKPMLEGPVVVEQLSSRVKSSNSGSIVEKHLPENFPFLGNVAVKEAHSNKVNSALTSLLSEGVNTVFDPRNVTIDKKKQGELSRMLYKSPPAIRNMSLCDEVPMDLSTTSRSRESKSESFILPRPEHEYEIPGNFKTESFITKIERQLTKMCEDTESVKYRRNDKLSFSSKHHKLRKNESSKKLHPKNIDQLQLNKMHMEKQNLGSQTSVSVIVGEKFLTKDSIEQHRQSVICEIKNSKLISNENNQVSSDSSNHLSSSSSSSIANNHCVSNVPPASGLQTTEKNPDHHDKGSVIQTIGHVSPSEITSLPPSKTDCYNNIVISERKNLGFRKCLLNEFKADKCGSKLISSSGNILIKGEVEDVNLLSKTKCRESKSFRKVSGCEESDPLNKYENAKPLGKRHISEEYKHVTETSDKCEVTTKLLNKDCENTKPLKEKGQCEETKPLKEKDQCEVAKPLCKSGVYEDAQSPLNKVVKSKESEPLNKEEKCEAVPLTKEKKLEEMKPVNKEGPCNEVKPASKEDPCSEVKPVSKEDHSNEVRPVSKEDPSDEVKPKSKEDHSNEVKPKSKDPSNEVKPKNKEDPSNEVKPKSKEDPSNEVKPKSKEDPSNEVKPKSKEDPSNEVKPKSKEDTSSKVKPVSKEDPSNEVKPKSKEDSSIKVKPVSKEDPNEVKPKSKEDSSIKVKPVSKEDPNEVKPKSKEDSSIKVKPVSKEDPNEVKPKSKEDSSIKVKPVSKEDPNEVKPKSKEDSSIKVKPVSKEDPNEVKPKSKEDSSIKVKPVSKEDPSNEVKPKSKEDSSSKVKPVSKEDPSNEVKPKSKEDSSSKVRPVSKEDSSSKVKPVSKEDRSDEVKPKNKEDSSNEVKPVSKEGSCNELKPVSEEDPCNEVKPVSKEGLCNKMKSVSKEDPCNEVKPISKEDTCNEEKRLLTKGKCSLLEPLSEDKCDNAQQASKGVKGEIQTLLSKGKSKLISMKGDSKEKNKAEVLCKKISEKVALESPLQSEETCNAPDASVDSMFVRNKDSLNDTEPQHDKKAAMDCSTSEVKVDDKTVCQKSPGIASECDAEAKRSTCESGIGGAKDSQKSSVQENAADSVENDKNDGKQQSGVENPEHSVEISKLDKFDKKSSDCDCSDEKTKEILDVEISNLEENQNSNLKGKESSKNILPAQTKEVAVESDAVDHEISCEDKIVGNESDKKTEEEKSEDLVENKNSTKKSDQSIDDVKSGDSLEKEHDVNSTGKTLEDDTSLVKHETVSDKENTELVLKKMDQEERPQAKSKLRRSRRTSRSYSEVHRSELETSALCEGESQKNKVHRSEQKSSGVSEKEPESQKSPEVNASDLTETAGTGKKNSDETVCNNSDLNENKCDKNFCEIIDVEKEHKSESKQKKSETKCSKSTARRSRNLRKSVRNTPKLDISSDKCIAPTLDDKTISNSEVTASDPVLPVSVSSEKFDKVKIKFIPFTKDSQFTCASEGHLCGMCISNVCFETKAKCKGDIKVMNNRHSKNEFKESFGKSLSKAITDESAVCGDHEESFSVGRMRTRGRLKRQCSVAAPPPPRVPPVKSKAAPSPVSKSTPSSASKVAQSSQSKPSAKNKVASPQVITSPAAAATTPRKRIRGKRASLNKTPIPDSILEIIGSSEEKNTSKNDKMKKISDKKSNEILSSALSVGENSENESTPVKRSRRIQEQNQKKISQLAVEMEQEQRRLEKLAKQNAAVAKNKQKEAVEKTTQKSVPPQHQQQARPSKKTSNKSETKKPEPAVVEDKNSPRKTRNRSRNLTKMTLIYEDDSKDLEYETSRDTIKSRRRRNGRRGRKKKYKPWDLSSESSSPSEEITEEEEEEPEELLVFNTNEDEFACEEIDENAEPVVIRRARTAKKAKSASESDGEAENEIAPDDKPCARCGKYDEPEWILLCDKCDSGYHTRCLAPPLMIIPDGDWYCPPCEHAFLVENLLVELRNLEQMLKQREREELRKQRLAYVGISLDNVLKPEKKEKQENESYDDDDEDDDDSDETSEEDRIYSKRSSRTRRVVNYQFKEFDELIQSAIEEEMMEFKLPEKTEEAPVDSNEDSEADVVAPSRRKKKTQRLNDLDFTDVEDSDEEYKGSSLSETEVSQSPQSDGSNSRHSGSSASWRGSRKTRSTGQKKRHKRKRSRHSGESDYMDGDAFRPTTRRAAQKKISYRELSSDEEWGDDKPTSKKWTKKRRQSSTSSESSGGSFRKQRSKKKPRIVQKWKKSESDSESEPKKNRSSVQKWQESESESEPKEVRKKSRVQRWEDSESGSDSGSRKAKKTRSVQKWEGSESESESDSKKSSSSGSESSGTSVQSTEKWKIKKSIEGNGIKININRKLLDSDSDSTSGQARHKKKSVSRIIDSEDSEESEDDDASKKVSDEESTSESNTGQKGYKEDGSLKNVPSSSVKDVKCGPQITVTAAEKMPETIADQVPPKSAAPHHIGIHLKGKASPSMQKVVKCVKPLARSMMKSDSEHKNFDSSISETFSNDSQSLQGLPTEHEEPMCESDSEPDPKLNRFSNDQYICKTGIFEKDSVYRPAKEDQSFNYNAAEEKSYQIPYTGLASLQDYSSRPSPLKPSMVESYSNSTSPSKLTPLDSYSEASSPKGFISLDTCSSFRKGSSFVSSDPEAKSRPILTSDNYQGEIRFPQEQYPPYERPSHLSPAPCPSSPAAFPQSPPPARDNASPPRMYSQYPEPYAGQRSPDYYHGPQYYGREEGVPRQNFVSNYSSSENVSPYPYNTNSSQQPNGGFMIDTLLRSRNPDGEEDELTGVTDIVSYITQE